jgi:putative methionine-R-sulfoxide reductase with GAF domain
MSSTVLDWMQMTTSSSKSTDLISELDTLVARAGSAEDLMNSIVALLREKLTRYNWVGFYMLDLKGDPNTLVLGPFRGQSGGRTRY